MDKAKESPYERHAAELVEDHQSGASTNEDNLYSPWMVVTRRKSGYNPAEIATFHVQAVTLRKDKDLLMPPLIGMTTRSTCMKVKGRA